MDLKIEPMCLGEVVVDGSFLVWGWDQGTSYRIPFSSYLILGGDHPVMVDAGARSVSDMREEMGLEVFQSEEQTLEWNLARHGLKPEDIGTLIITHLHVDHTGLADKLPNASIYVQRAEMHYAAAPYFPPGFYDRVDIAKLVDPLYHQLKFLEGDAEIMPGVRVILTGGHAPAHQMVYVDVDSGQAIITGDNVYRKDPALKGPLLSPPGLVHNLADAMLAVEKIVHDGKHILPMHDPAVYDEYPDGVY